VHAATLARQVRVKSERPEAFACVWEVHPETGALNAEIIPYATPIVIDLSPWKIVWNEGIKQSVHKLRGSALPNETGGVLLGYFDLKLNTIYVVDALSAPIDSQGDETGFTRGKEGLVEHIQTVQAKTGNIVNYIGDWHSHPHNASSNPSADDFRLLSYLAAQLQRDGLPALMLIVSETDENFLLGSAF
jgi:integrative and conjugative element protein (TIGR02256 family)